MTKTIFLFKTNDGVHVDISTKGKDTEGHTVRSVDEWSDLMSGVATSFGLESEPKGE